MKQAVVGLGWQGATLLITVCLLLEKELRWLRVMCYRSPSLLQKITEEGLYC